MVTLEEAVERVRPFVEARPEYVYEPVDVLDEDGEVYGIECRYFNADGTPSCIVGHAYADELRGIDWIEGSSVVALKHDLGLNADANNFLYELQTQQDRKVPWGQAFAKAYEFAKSRSVST